MAEKASNVVLNFKMDGQVQYAETLKQINAVMNTAAKEYKNHIAAMGSDASATDKLRAEKKKLEIQMEGAQKRTKMLRAEYEAMAKDTNTTTDQLTAMYGKVLDAERAETSLQKSLERVNDGLSDQATESRSNKESLEQLNVEQKLLESQSEKLTSEFKLQTSELGDNATEAEKNALAQENLAKQSEIAEKQIQNMEKQLALTKAEFGENSVEANKMESELNSAKTAFNKLGTEAESAGNSADTASGQLSGIKAALDAGLLMDAAEKLGAIKDKLLEIGTAALEAFGLVDEGLDTIITKTGATGETADGLETVFRNIASSMPVELLKIGEAVGETNTQFGSMGDELQRQTELLLKYAEINGTDVADSAITAKQAIEAYSLSNEDLEYVLDSVTSVAQATGQSVDDLMGKAIDGAPQIKALGLSFDEGTELMGKFEKAGVDSSATLGSLAKASVAYAKDGKTLEEGLQGTVDAIMNASSETEALTIASETFGTKGAARMVDAIQRGAISFDDLGDNIEGIAGVTESTFAATLDPIDQMTITANDAKLGLAELGGAIAETLEPILKRLSEVIKSVAEWFTNLSPGMKDMIVIVGLVTTAVAAVLPILVGLAAAALFAETTVGALILSMLPIIGVIVGVIAAVTAIILIIQNWGTIVDWLKEKFALFGIDLDSVFQSIKEVIESVVQAVSDFVMNIWGQMVAWWNENNELIRATIDTVWSYISEKVQNILNVIVPAIQAAWSLILMTTQTLWELVKGVIQIALDVILGVIKTAMQIINGDWSGAWETVKSTASSVWETIKSTIANAFSAIASNISGVMSGISSSVTNAWNTIKTGISNAINGAKDAVSSAIGTIKSIMNFSWSLPKLALPHFSLSGKFSLNPPSVPKLSVDWYKNGGIFTEPTIFQAANGRIRGFGDGPEPEAALPLNAETLGAIGKGIAANMQGVGGTVVVPVYLDGKEIARVTTKHVDRNMQSNSRDLNFGTGRK